VSNEKPLYVRLPAAEAERLEVAAFNLKASKKDLVARLISEGLGGEPRPVAVSSADPRRVTVELGGDAPVVGRHEFHPLQPPEVLTPAQVAELLQVPEGAVLELAESGELPGRRVGEEWRFSRAAVLAWLGG
jgi:excisionase family DNA binding protein